MVDRTALARATESTSSPTPGYLYNDIAKSAAISPASASEVATYLIRRLQSKNNVNIKYKCLKVIQMVSTNAATRGQFKRVIVQDTTAVCAIKACLQFRGPPDAVHGDMLYEKVRVQAKETLDAVYSDDPVSDQQNYSSAGSGSGGGGVSSGYGNQSSYGGGGGNYGSNNSSYNPSSSSASSGPKKMEGIGNPMFADPRHNQQKEYSDMTVRDVVSGVREGFVGMIKDPLARKVTAGANSSAPRPGGMGGGYGGPSGGWKSAPPGQSQLTQATNGAWTMASNRGPNAYNSESYTSGTGTISSGVGGSWGAPAAPSATTSSSSSSSIAYQSRQAAHNNPPRASVVHIAGATGGANADGTYERNLITELCPPGGMKAEPPPDKLQSFAQAIPNLNPDLTCPALLDALEDGQPWIIRAKALCVMEVCINVAEESVRTGMSGNNAYADFFHACKEEIEPLASHSRSAVRDPAKRVLKALGLDFVQQSSATVQKDAVLTPAPAAPAPNLLDFDEDSAPPVPPPPTENPPPLPADVPPAPPAPAVTPTTDNGSLFGGMNLKDTKTLPSNTNMESVNSNDLLGDMVQSEPAQQSSLSQGGDFFGDVTMKATNNVSTTVEKENVENSATTSTSTASSSGFSFISGGTTDVKAQSTPSTPANMSESVTNTFDPLLSLGTSVPTNRMQQSQTPINNSNPNMAAVVQQQQHQILMMQAQMQQMQMSGSSRFMMTQQGTAPGSSNSIGISPNMKQSVMGANNGSGVATSFAFMEDPNKARREASNKKFAFVQDAMKGAK